MLDFVRLLLLHPVANRFLMDEDKERSAPKTSPLDKVFGATISVHMRIRGIIKGISVCSAFIPSYHRSRSHQDNGGPSCLRAILGFVFQGNVRTPVADRRALKVTPPPSLTAHLHSLTHLLIISSALSHSLTSCAHHLACYFSLQVAANLFQHQAMRMYLGSLWLSDAGLRTGCFLGASGADASSGIVHGAARCFRTSPKLQVLSCCYLARYF